MNDTVSALVESTTLKKLFTQWDKANRKYTQWGGLWGSAKSLTCACIAKHINEPILVICTNSYQARCFVDDLITWGCNPILFPARESALGAETNVLKDRQTALELIQRNDTKNIFVTTTSALIQAVPDNNDEKYNLNLKEDMRQDPGALAATLIAAGYERVPAISEAGEFSVRGDIFDFFPPAIGEPLRLEFFDDELESIRIFDIGSQRTRHTLKRIRVPLTLELSETAKPGEKLLLDILPKNFHIISIEPNLIKKQNLSLSFLGKDAVENLKKLDGKINDFQQIELMAMPGEQGDMKTLSVEEFCIGVAEGIKALAKKSLEGDKVYIKCSTEAEADRLKQVCNDQALSGHEIIIERGDLTQGFRDPENNLIILHHRELIPGHGVHRPKIKKKIYEAQNIESALQLNTGDLVVHAVHGLARFQGIDRERQQDIQQDYLLLEFAEKAELRVPISRIDLIEKYIGAGGDSPKLDRMGSGAFRKRKSKVENAVEDLAAQMLSIQAKRNAIPSLPCSPLGPEQREFEASFAYTDTPDQAHCTQEIHDDLSTPRPMDRLLCGDVGYGKTELAARSAFRAILSGRQVAMLVPTTILASQHFQSIVERFSGWPVRIELLSRLITAAKQKKLVRELADGKIDFLIGTHRILSKTVRFKNLGLVIIDEEQRFGVKHKEILKQKKEQVDVLTLSATPVPRTLHMAMAGIRDISSLSTAPIGRQEVHTEIRYDNDDALIQSAIRRELSRGGQIFFLHNRVKTLQIAAEKLNRIVPEARIVVGHGQQNINDLNNAMDKFLNKKADILCATTIIESGLDIPNANTIFIDQAHRYGLADMHQLRGRVGRSDRQGYCYLLIPKNQPLPNDARRRLKAIEEMKYLGAGFQLAIKDLEIRGAGNLLGAEQSGHIQAVGYETYRKLLKNAVAKLKNNSTHDVAKREACELSLGISASLPPEYISDEKLRIEVLKKLDKVKELNQCKREMRELQDRFGSPPQETIRLINFFYLKNCLPKFGIIKCQHIDNYLDCTINDAQKFEKKVKKTGLEIRVMSLKKSRIMLPKNIATKQDVLELLINMSMI